MESDWDIIKDLIVIIISVLVGVGLIICIVMWLSSIGCHKSFPTYQTKWTIWTKCMVEVNGHYVPARNLRIFDE